jgi:hypothetical protein
MSQYLLSTYATGGEVEGSPRTPEQWQAFMERVMTLEAEMDARGTFVFGGALHGPEAATVVRPSGGERIVTTDGPFIESKEQIGGFYIIDAGDLDEALGWARKVAEATGHPIEVRPFRATGRLTADPVSPR